MPGFLKQATAAQSRALGPFVDSTDFLTPETGLTIANTDIKLVVNGGASADKNSGGGTHRVNGVYGVTFDATDTATIGEMEVSVVVAGALPVFDKYVVLEEAVYDALFAASAPGYLQPTTAGRTLDVSAGGEAGIDWANIGSPTTAQNLSATNIDVDQVVASVSGAVGSVTGLTAATVHSDLDDIQARLPAALTAGGKIKASMDEILAVAQSATDLKDFADDGYDPVTDKVQGVVLTDTVTTYTGNTPQTGDAFARLGAPAGASVSADVAAVKAETASIQIDTNDIQTRLPAALVSGRIDASVGAMAADVVTAAAIAADAIGSSELAASAVNEIADQVWEEAIVDHSGTTGSTAEALNAAGAAGDPWTTQLPGAYGAGSAGKIIGDNIDAPMSAVKTQTDKLTFDVDNALDANVQKINDTELTGDGSTGTPWGPV